MKADSYSHLIEIDEKQRFLTIYRIRDDRRQFYTSVKIPEKKWSENPDEVKEFCRILGENIILDSPQARKLFDI